VAAAIVCGAGNGLGAGINMTVGSDLAPKGHDTGPFLGLWRAITDTGGTLGPVAVGGIAQVLALGPAAAAVGLGGLVGVVLMGRLMPETRGFRR
jgi:MFS family permease